MNMPRLAHKRQKLQILLRQVRQEAGLRQADVARKLGRVPSFVSKIEHGRHRIDVAELSQFCDVVGIDLLVFCRRYRAYLKVRSRPEELENHRRIHKPKSQGR